MRLPAVDVESQHLDTKGGPSLQDSGDLANTRDTIFHVFKREARFEGDEELFCGTQNVFMIAV